MASLDAHDHRVDLRGTVQVLHAHLTASLWQAVFEQPRTTARARPWAVAALAACWTAVLLRAPQSLPHALEEAAVGPGTGWPAGQASPEAFFERCPSLPWRFCAKLSEAFIAQGLPKARPCSAQP